MNSKEDIIKALEFSVKVFNAVPITGSGPMRTYAAAVANVEVILDGLKKEAAAEGGAGADGSAAAGAEGANSQTSAKAFPAS